MAKYSIKFRSVSNSRHERLSVRVEIGGESLRIRELSDRTLGACERTLIRALGPALMLYEMKSLLVTEKERAKLNFDDPSDAKPVLHWRWRGLVMVRAEQRRRARTQQETGDG